MQICPGNHTPPNELNPLARASSETKYAMIKLAIAGAPTSNGNAGPDQHASRERKPTP